MSLSWLVQHIDSSMIILVFLIIIWIFSSRENENLFFRLLLRKLFMYFDSALFMVLSKDSKGVGPKYNHIPDGIKKGSYNKMKRVVFIRHGESDWNNIFNKGINLKFFPRLLSSIWQEFCLLPTLNSVFLDSPLNFEGIEQVIVP
jgi:hypothetical protein